MYCTIKSFKYSARQLLEIHLLQKHAESKRMPNWSTNFEVNLKRKAYFATLVIDKINFTSQSNLAGRPMVSALQKTQRVSTSTPAPDAVVPPATKSLKTRETLKPPPKFADEFSGLDSNNIK